MNRDFQNSPTNRASLLVVFPPTPNTAGVPQKRIITTIEVRFIIVRLTGPIETVYISI